MKFSRIASLFAFVVLTIVAAVPAAQAQHTVGTITQVQGTPNLKRNGASIAATRNMPVILHGRVATDANSSLTIGLVEIALYNWERRRP